MTSPTTIRRLAVQDLNIPLHTPFGIAGGAQDVARNLLVTVELADGTLGYGEAAPFPAYNGETQDDARTAVDAARARVEGGDAREWRRIGAALREESAMVGAARCALETALLDALTRHAQLPLWAFFGGASTTLETDMTITTGSVDQAAAAARDILGRGIRVIKIKVGGGDLAADVERVLAIRAAAPGSPLMLDGNAGLSPDGALQLLAALHEADVVPVLFEQPVARDDWDGLHQVAQWGEVPVAADESAASAADVLRVVQARAAHVVNIKLMKCGVVEALDIAGACRAAGLRLMIGGNVESTLAMTVSACFAAGLGGFDFVDLDTPLFLAENPFEGGMVYRGATIDLSEIAAGHGVTPRA